jgi:hypothetical protein
MKNEINDHQTPSPNYSKSFFLTLFIFPKFLLINSKCFDLMITKSGWLQFNLELIQVMWDSLDRISCYIERLVKETIT